MLEFVIKSPFIYCISSGQLTLFKVIFAPIQVSDIFDLTVLSSENLAFNIPSIVPEMFT